MLIHLTYDISPLIKLSFNIPKSTRGLDALSFLMVDVEFLHTSLTDMIEHAKLQFTY
jgi:hypothetical protein